MSSMTRRARRVFHNAVFWAVHEAPRDQGLLKREIIASGRVQLAYQYLVRVVGPQVMERVVETSLTHWRREKLLHCKGKRWTSGARLLSDTLEAAIIGAQDDQATLYEWQEEALEILVKAVRRLESRGRLTFHEPVAAANQLKKLMENA